MGRDQVCVSLEEFGVLSRICFANMIEAPSRVRDLTSGELKYRWTETGALDHYRFAHAFDHLYGAFRRRMGVVAVI